MTALGDHDITQHPGTAVPVPPAAAFDWAAQAQGAGTRTLRWTVSGGDWIVVMNPDGSPGITVRADAGVTLPVLPALAGELFAAGITVGLIGAALETGFAVRLTQSHGITSLPTAAARTHRVTDATKLPDSTCLPGGLAAARPRRSVVPHRPRVSSDRITTPSTGWMYVPFRPTAVLSSPCCMPERPGLLLPAIAPMSA